LIISS